MTLVTTAQRRGVDAIAAAWAAKHGVPLVGFTLMGRGASAAFKRNAQLAKLAPVEAIVCQGSGVQAKLYQVLRRGARAHPRFPLRRPVPGTDGARHDSWSRVAGAHVAPAILHRFGPCGHK